MKGRARPGASRTEPAGPFRVWREGYVLNGDSAPAHVVAVGDWPDLDTAMHDLVARGRFKHSTYPVAKVDGYWQQWGCRFFDNEADARRSFG